MFVNKFAAKSVKINFDITERITINERTSYNQ